MQDEEFTGTIEVVGQAQVSAPPDEALVMLDVITQADTATAAVSANAELTQAVIDAVEAQPNHGVTTSGLSVHPIYAYDPDTNTSEIAGFRARNGIRVETKPGAAGRVFDAGVAAGANVSSGISYRIQDPTLLREQALREAVEHAAGEARILADAAGVALLGPESIAVDPTPMPIALRAESMAADGPATPTIPEEVAVEARVRVRYRTRVG